MDRLLLPKHGALPQNDGGHFGELGPEYMLIPNLEIPDQADRFLEIDALLMIEDYRIGSGAILQDHSQP